MNKLVLVSGSSRGLGAHIAKNFINEGYQVALNYFLSKEKAEALESLLGENCKSFYADVASRDDVRNMVSQIENHFGKVPSILVNNALANYQFNGDLRKKAEEITKIEKINIIIKEISTEAGGLKYVYIQKTLIFLLPVSLLLALLKILRTHKWK